MFDLNRLNACCLVLCFATLSPGRNTGPLTVRAAFISSLLSRLYPSVIYSSDICKRNHLIFTDDLLKFYTSRTGLPSSERGVPHYLRNTKRIDCRNIQSLATQKTQPMAEFWMLLCGVLYTLINQAFTCLFTVFAGRFPGKLFKNGREITGIIKSALLGNSQHP